MGGNQAPLGIGFIVDHSFKQQYSHLAHQQAKFSIRRSHAQATQSLPLHPELYTHSIDYRRSQAD